MPATRKKTARKKAKTARGPRADGGMVLNRISSAAVERATGKSWEQWLRALDAAGAKGLEHKAIVRIVSTRFGIGAWWRQMVTVGYEMARGQRVQHQRTRGFEITVSRTIGAAPERVFDAFHDAGVRGRWLPERLEARRATRPRALRFAGPGALPTLVSVDISSKPGGRCSVTVGHSKLASAGAGEKAKKLWSRRLDALKEMLGAGER